MAKKIHLTFEGIPRRELKRIFLENLPQVNQSNLNMFRQVTLATLALLAAMTVLSLFLPGWKHLTFAYSVSFVVVGISCLLARFWLSGHIKLIFPALYTYVVWILGLSIYLSMFSEPKGTSMTFIALIIILPMAIIDHPWRILTVVTLGVAVFCTCAVATKTASAAADDVANCIIFAVLGVLIGQKMCAVRLIGFEHQRELTIQRDTDSLTLLPNRRKLFETLSLNGTKSRSEWITGVLMLDIDFFKRYNDLYGHQEGDECLRKLGGRLMMFGDRNGLDFYRYGGEEFIALSKKRSYEELLELAKRLLSEVERLQIPFQNSPFSTVTISIGVAEQHEGNNCGYQSLIHMADEALYHAKANGRNQAAGFLQCVHTC